VQYRYSSMSGVVRIGGFDMLPRRVAQCLFWDLKIGHDFCHIIPGDDSALIPECVTYGVEKASLNESNLRKDDVSMWKHTFGV
jgi:hypothetical protein